jgi:hypothetical protein
MVFNLYMTCLWFSADITFIGPKIDDSTWIQDRSYTFGFRGMESSRSEMSDEDGNVRGTYTIPDQEPMLLNFFYLLLMTRPNQLECLHLQKLSNVVLHLLVASGAYPRRKHLKGPPIGFALALPSNSKTRLERGTKGKPYSFLGLVVSDKGKKFYNIDTRRETPS